MRVHRSTPKANFTILPNEAINDVRLSNADLGALVRMVSRKSGTRMDIKTMSGRFSDGQGSVSRSMTRLEDCGYLTRQRVRDPETGRITTNTDVYDVPRDPSLGFPSPGGSSDLPTGVITGFNDDVSTGLKDDDNVPPTSPTPPQESGGREDVVIDEKDTPSVELLAQIGQSNPRLLVGRREMPVLLPLIAEWRSRGYGDHHIRQAITEGLPERVYSARAFLEHRLREKMPERAVQRPVGASGVRPECSDCGRPVKKPGVCGVCAPKPQSVTNITETRRLGAVIARQAAMEAQVKAKISHTNG